MYASEYGFRPVNPDSLDQDCRRQSVSMHAPAEDIVRTVERRLQRAALLPLPSPGADEARVPIDARHVVFDDDGVPHLPSGTPSHTFYDTDTGEQKGAGLEASCPFNAQCEHDRLNGGSSRKQKRVSDEQSWKLARGFRMRYSTDGAVGDGRAYKVTHPEREGESGIIQVDDSGSRTQHIQGLYNHFKPGGTPSSKGIMQEALQLALRHQLSRGIKHFVLEASGSYPPLPEDASREEREAGLRNLVALYHRRFGFEVEDPEDFETSIANHWVDMVASAAAVQAKLDADAGVHGAGLLDEDTCPFHAQSMGGGFFSDAFNRVRNAATSAGQAVSGAASAAGQAVSGALNTAKNTVVEGATRAVNAVRGVRTGMPPGAQATLDQYALWTITGLVVRRDPVQKALSTVMNLVSLGAWNRARAQYGFDDVFHLGLLIDLEAPDRSARARVLAEKNAVINLGTPKPTEARTQELRIPPPSPPVTLGDFWAKAAAAKGPAFYLYDAFNNNCQDFVLGLLHANGASTESADKFIKQRLEQVIAQQPSWLGKVANVATNLGARVDRIAQGGALDDGSDSDLKGGTLTPAEIIARFNAQIQAATAELRELEALDAALDHASDHRGLDDDERLNLRKEGDDVRAQFAAVRAHKARLIASKRAYMASVALDADPSGQPAGSKRRRDGDSDPQGGSLLAGGSAASNWVAYLAGKKQIDLTKLPAEWWGDPPEPGKPNKWDKYLAPYPAAAAAAVSDDAYDYYEDGQAQGTVVADDLTERMRKTEREVARAVRHAEREEIRKILSAPQPKLWVPGALQRPSFVGHYTQSKKLRQRKLDEDKDSLHGAGVSEDAHEPYAHLALPSAVPRFTAHTMHLSRRVAAEMEAGPLPHAGHGTRSSGWFPPGKAGDLERLAPKLKRNTAAHPRENRLRPFYDINAPIAVPPVSGYARWAPVTGVSASTHGRISATDADRRAWMARTQMAAVPSAAKTEELFRDPYGDLQEAYPQNRLPPEDGAYEEPVAARAPSSIRLLGGGAVANPGLSAAPMTGAPDPADPGFVPREDLSSQWEALKIVPGNISGNRVIAAQDAPPPAAHVVDLVSDSEGEAAEAQPTPEVAEGAMAAAPLNPPAPSAAAGAAPGAPAPLPPAAPLDALLAAPGAPAPPPPAALPAAAAASTDGLDGAGLAGGKRKRRPRTPGCKADRRNALVGRLMKEEGLSLAAASKKVKESGMEY